MFAFYLKKLAIVAKTLLLCSLLFLLRGYSYAQDYQILESHGEIPDEFLQSSLEKAADEITDKSSDGFNLRKQEKEFYVQSNYLVDRLLKSGKVLFNDSISLYVNRVADEILKNEPDLRKELRFYVIKSPYVNAFCTDNGIIFVNLGLIAQLENEAQLAFILCHEIAHYTEGHSLQGYLENLEIESGAGQYRSMSLNDRLLSRSNFSKSQEFDADDIGYKRFEKTGYDVDAAEAVFYVLQFSHLPFDEVAFETAYLENDYYSIPDDAILDELDPIDLEEEDDEYGTHPDAASRRAKLSAFINSFTGEGVDFKVSEKEFRRLQKIARYEMTRLYIIGQAYAEALYNAFLLEKHYPGEVQNEVFKIQSLIGLADYKASYDLSDICEHHSDIEGESQQLYHIVNELSRETMSTIAAVKAYEAFKAHPENELLRKLSFNAINNLVRNHGMHLDDFAEKPADLSEDEVEEPADSTETDEPKNKYDKIKAQMKEQVLDNEMVYSFTEYYKDRPLVNFFSRAEKGIIGDDVIATSDENDSTLDINKILLIQPFYYKYSERGSDEFKMQKSEKSRISYTETFDQMAEQSGLEMEVFSPSVFDKSEVEKFNDYSVLVDWLTETFDNDEKDITSSSYPLSQELINKYNTRYVAITGVISVNESKLEDYYRAGCACLLVYTAPFGIYYVARPQQKTYLIFSIYDLETGKEVETFFYDYNTRDHNYIVKSSIYDALIKTTEL